MYCAMCHSNIWLYHVEILAISHTIQKETDFNNSNSSNNDDDDHDDNNNNNNNLDKYELREH